MANYATLKAAIAAAINQNGNNEITGALLQAQLLAIVNSLGAGYQYMGIATPSTNPGTPDQNVFYFALQGGTYSNFGAIEINAGLAILTYNGDWAKIQVFSIDEQATPGGNNLVKGNNLYNVLSGCGGLGFVPLSVSWLTGYYLMDTGALYQYGGQENIVSDYIPVTPGKTYYFAGSRPSVNWSAISGYAADKSFVKRLDVPDVVTTKELQRVVIPSGIYYVRIAAITTTNEYAGIWEIQPNSIAERLFNDCYYYNVNIIDPAYIQTECFLGSSGGISTMAGITNSVYNKYIPVESGEKLFVECRVSASSTILTFAAYDETGAFVRGVIDNEYTQQGTERYVKIGFPGMTTEYPTPFANRGTKLLPYAPYLGISITEKINNIVDVLGTKLDKIFGPNLVDMSKIIGSSYIATNGSVAPAAGDNFFVSDYIPVNGQNLCSNARNTSPVSAWSVYGKNKDLLRTSYSDGGSKNYTYQSGDYYIRFSFDKYQFKAIGDDYVSAFACYGDTLAPYLPYTDYKPLAELAQRVDKISPSTEELTIKTPNYIYTICDDKVAYSLGFFADHCVNLGAKKQAKLLFKETGKDHLTLMAPAAVNIQSQFVWNNGNNKDESQVNGTIVGDYADKAISFVLRSILNTYTKDNGIRVLCIGDSVTNGTGSWYPEEWDNVSDNPNAGKRHPYWRIMQELCIMDKANHNNAGYDFVSIGKQSEIEYVFNGQTRKCFAEGRGGWGISHYLYEETYNTLPNLFYDANKVWSGNYAEELNSAGVKFSLASYLAKYKTLADDGVTRLVVGSTAGSEITDINECDVCTPNVIVIQLSHNQGAAEYASNMPIMIKAIRNEYPNIPILLSIVDETGTYNNALYPQFDYRQVQFSGLHTQIFTLIDTCKTLENSFSGVYYCPSNFIQPTAWSVTTRPTKRIEAFIKEQPDFVFGNQWGAGPNYHPAGYAHAAWAYQMLAMIKWILSN